jgi:hypothetical protein
MAPLLIRFFSSFSISVNVSETALNELRKIVEDSGIIK